ncbi:MAG: M23 family metallopeptidase [Myxococcales bacterium]|nr:M23 family metallopeptidase [Myxococcales bacterium]
MYKQKLKNLQIIPKSVRISVLGVLVAIIIAFVVVSATKSSDTEQTTRPNPLLSMLQAAQQAHQSAEPAAPVVPSHLKTVTATIDRTLSHTLMAAIGPGGDALSAEVSRLLVWDINLRRDLRQGDTLSVVWEGTTPDTLVVHAVRLDSGKLGRPIEAFRFAAPNDLYPSYWSADGIEVPFRLNNTPIDNYEQITSLLKDRPRHHGMDFMAPVGTIVQSPYAGTVTKTDWNLAANGNCVEIRFEDGILAKFLHLSRTDVKAGDRVEVGQKIGLSGNTGRSTGPHLHYQLNRGKTVVDPLDYHGTTRRTLSAEVHPSLSRVVEEMRRLLSVENQPTG